MKASVIIPNYNGLSLLDDCLGSLMEQTFIDFEVIVADNNSKDGSVEFIKKNFLKVKILNLSKNYGFAKAINEGVKISQSEYVVFLNNDTRVDPDFLKFLIAAADKNKGAVSVNPKILNYYKKELIDGVGIEINEVLQAKSIGWNQKDCGQFEDKRFIFGATGGASLFRKDIFKNLGGFDDKYFMYYEEVDFAFRAQFAGFKSIFEPKARVYHKHKATARKTPQRQEYWQFKNMYATIIKDYPCNLLLKKFRWLKILLVFLNTFIYQIKNGFLWPPFMVCFWLTVNLPYLLNERQKIQKQRLTSDSYIENFLVKKKISLWGLIR